MSHSGHCTKRFHTNFSPHEFCPTNILTAIPEHLGCLVPCSLHNDDCKVQCSLLGSDAQHMHTDMTASIYNLAFLEMPLFATQGDKLLPADSALQHNVLLVSVPICLWSRAFSTSTLHSTFRSMPICSLCYQSLLHKADGHVVWPPQCGAASHCFARRHGYRKHEFVVLHLGTKEQTTHKGVY